LPRPRQPTGIRQSGGHRFSFNQDRGAHAVQFKSARSSYKAETCRAIGAGERSTFGASLWLADPDDPADCLFLVCFCRTRSRPRLTRGSITATRQSSRWLSLAATLPMMAGRIDLTIGFGIVMWHILAIQPAVKFGVPWPVAILSSSPAGRLVGLLNGLPSKSPK